MRLRVIVSAILMALAASALANGSMGLGLEMWHPVSFLVYVVVITVLEIWLLGRWLYLSWHRAAAVGLTANFFTAIACSICFSPIHSPFVGTPINPNPLLNAVVILAIFAIPSAILESVPWYLAAGPEAQIRGRQKKVALVVLAIHLIEIPLGLTILLLPSRPYLGSEAVAHSRRMWVRHALGESLWDYVREHERLPNVHSVADLGGLIQSNVYPPSEAWAAFYHPVFHRFDTGESGRLPFQINWSAFGQPVLFLEGPENIVWLVKPPQGYPGRGLSIDTTRGTVYWVDYPSLRRYAID